jgi:hypothetical protein
MLIQMVTASLDEQEVKLKKRSQMWQKYSYGRNVKMRCEVFSGEQMLL